MSELFVIFKQHLVWALMLWVLFFVAFAALFAGRQLTTFAAGVARVLAGIVVTPFVFIRRAVQSVLRFDRAEEETYRASDQYLLNKAMLVLQALVIVIAIGVLAAGAVATWNAWVPPSEVRREARELRAKVVEQRATSGTANAALAKLESEWAQKRDAVVTKFRRERESRVAAAQKNIAATEEIFAQYGSARGTEKFAELQAYVQQITRTPDNIRETKERLDRMVAYSWGLVGWEDQTLRAWNERWETKALAEYELANVPMDALRAEEQPGYEKAKATTERESSTLTTLEEQSKQWDEAASLKWKAAAWRLGGAFVTFLAFVWLSGALIEAGWLAIRIADDVRRMREAAPRPVALPEATQPEVR
ncbi:MAG: hypothetical protein ACJ74H_14105, partial [Thermoanaerobaculia bacterium]